MLGKVWVRTRRRTWRRGQSLHLAPKGPRLCHLFQLGNISSQLPLLTRCQDPDVFTRCFEFMTKWVAHHLPCNINDGSRSTICLRQQLRSVHTSQGETHRKASHTRFGSGHPNSINSDQFSIHSARIPKTLAFGTFGPCLTDAKPHLSGCQWKKCN